MRDLVILAVLVAVVLWTLKAPWIGVIAWTVTSLMTPHVQFGYAAKFWPVATAVGGATLVGLMATSDRQNPLWGSGPKWLLAFVIWTSFTLPFSLYFDSSFGLWVRSLKIYLMVFVSLALVTDRKRLQVFIWANVLSIAYYGVKGGLFTILTGGNHRVWGPGGFIEGNNEVALAAITVIPLMRYLQLQLTDRRATWAMTGAMGLSAIMALGTQSRGALIGLVAMASYFWLKGKNKVGWGVAIAMLVMVVLALMPASWWSRMDTIKTYDQDASAMGRINAWWMAFNLAKARPVGGGFNIYTPEVFSRFAPVANDVHAAHSVWFQVLGEHGFIGLFLFLGIGVATWLTARSLITAARQDPAQRWAGDLGTMVQVSMIGYGATGTFLSLAYYDLPYNVMAMATLALLFIRRNASQSADVPVAGGLAQAAALGPANGRTRAAPPPA